MKICNVCKVSKPPSEFFRCKAFKDGLDYTCKECSKARRKAWGAVNRDRARIIANRSFHAHKSPERSAAAFAKWYAKTKVDGTFHRHTVKAQRRRATKLQAIPSWSNQFFVDEAYELAQHRSQVTSVEYVVDHIVPLQHPNVCGLHTHTNLRVITDFENCSKKNYRWPDMWAA